MPDDSKRSSTCTEESVARVDIKSPSPLTSGDEGKLRIVSRDNSPDAPSTNASNPPATMAARLPPQPFANQDASSNKLSPPTRKSDPIRIDSADSAAARNSASAHTSNTPLNNSIGQSGSDMGVARRDDSPATHQSQSQHHQLYNQGVFGCATGLPAIATGGPSQGSQANGGGLLSSGSISATIVEPQRTHLPQQQHQQQQPQAPPNFIISSPTMGSFPYGFLTPQLGQPAIILNSCGQPLILSSPVFSATSNNNNGNNNNVNNSANIGGGQSITGAAPFQSTNQINPNASSGLVVPSSAGSFNAAVFGGGGQAYQQQSGAYQRQMPPVLFTCRMPGPNASGFPSGAAGSVIPYTHLASNTNAFATFGGFNNAPILLPGGQQMLMRTPQGLIAFQLPNNASVPSSSSTGNLATDGQSFACAAVTPKLPTVLPKPGSIFPIPQGSSRSIGPVVGGSSRNALLLPSANPGPSASTNAKFRNGAKEIDLVSPAKSSRGNMVRLELNEKLRRESEKKLKEGKNSAQIDNKMQPLVPAAPAAFPAPSPTALFPPHAPMGATVDPNKKSVPPVQQALPPSNPVAPQPSTVSGVKSPQKGLKSPPLKAPPVSTNQNEAAAILANSPSIDQKRAKPAPKRRHSNPSTALNGKSRKSDGKKPPKATVIDFGDRRVAKEMHDMFVQQMECSCITTLVDSSQILTHYIDSFVIQESLEPFAISPLIFDDLPLFMQTAASAANFDWLAPPRLTPERSTTATTTTSAVGSPTASSDELPPTASKRRRLPSSASTVHTSGFASPPHLADVAMSKDGGGGVVCAACARSLTPSAAGGFLAKNGLRYCSKICYRSRRKRRGASRDDAISSATASKRKRSKNRDASRRGNGRSVSVPSSQNSPRRNIETPSELPSTSNSFISGMEEPSPLLLGDKNTVDWTVDDVQNWLVALGPGTSQYTAVFRQQEIDGQALLLLQEDHLVRQMGLKLGPAVKICAALKCLRN